MVPGCRNLDCILCIGRCEQEALNGWNVGLEFTSTKEVSHPSQKTLYVNSKTVRDLNAFGELDYLDDEGEERDTNEHDWNRFIDKSGREVSNQIDKEMMQLQLRYWWSFVVTPSTGRISASKELS